MVKKRVTKKKPAKKAVKKKGRVRNVFGSGDGKKKPAAGPPAVSVKIPAPPPKPPPDQTEQSRRAARVASALMDIGPSSDPWNLRLDQQAEDAARTVAAFCNRWKIESVHTDLVEKFVREFQGIPDLDHSR